MLSPRSHILLPVPVLSCFVFAIPSTLVLYLLLFTVVHFVLDRFPFSFIVLLQLFCPDAQIYFMGVRWVVFAAVGFPFIYFRNLSRF